jgi:hypothetical protein
MKRNEFGRTRSWRKRSIFLDLDWRCWVKQRSTYNSQIFEPVSTHRSTLSRTHSTKIIHKESVPHRKHTVSPLQKPDSWSSWGTYSPFDTSTKHKRAMYHVDKIHMVHIVTTALWTVYFWRRGESSILNQWTRSIVFVSLCPFTSLLVINNANRSGNSKEFKTRSASRIHIACL